MGKLKRNLAAIFVITFSTILAILWPCPPYDLQNKTDWEVDAKVIIIVTSLLLAAIAFLAGLIFLLSRLDKIVNG